jgi:hypothetical protein
MAIVNFANIMTSGLDEDILTTATPGEHIRNYGALTTTGDLAEAIFASADDVSIRNFGQIETSGLGAAGIFVLGDDAHIVNYGSVTTRGGFYDGDPGTEDDDSYSEGVVAIGDRFFVANYGSIRVEGLFSSGMSGVGNDGTVINYGRIASTAFGSSVIAAIGDRSQAINAGQMIVGADSAGLFARGEDAVALNRGRILIAADEGVAVQGVVAAAHLTNRGIILVNAGHSLGMGGFGDAQEVRNFGRIEAHGAFSRGIEASGARGAAGLDMEVLNAGRISTDGDLATGIALGLNPDGFRPASHGAIVNRGTVETSGDGAIGVALIGDRHSLANSGRIASDGGAADSASTIGLLRAAAVVVSGDDAVVKNTHSGVMRSGNADSAAVEMNVVERDGVVVAETSSRLENLGLIRGAAVAVLGGAGEETVVNRGRIVGDVVLGAGDDSFVFARHGQVVGDVFLGAGNDHVRVDNGAGRAAIADFTAGASSGDVVDVSAFFSSFGALKSHAVQHGADVVIRLDHNDILVLEHVQRSALTAGDFLFA